MKQIVISPAKWRRIRKDVNKESEQFLSKHNDISCHNCKENYCCINQKHIEVFDLEFKNLEYYIEEKHVARAEKEMERTDGLISCPFNDPETGMCDIYENRFSICSSQAVISPIEDCNSLANPGGGTMTIDRMDFINQFSKDPLAYMYTLAHKGEESNHDIIQQFRMRKEQ